jgi:hypothetical protein
MATKYWMVHGNGTPNYKHPSLHAAKLEAERLARMIPGQYFTVLEAVATVVKSELTWEAADKLPECPDDLNF